MFKSQIGGLALNRRTWLEIGPEWSPCRRSQASRTGPVAPNPAPNPKSLHGTPPRKSEEPGCKIDTAMCSSILALVWLIRFPGGEADPCCEDAQMSLASETISTGMCQCQADTATRPRLARRGPARCPTRSGMAPPDLANRSEGSG